jgi:lipopolysaccharide export system protein LptA
MANSALRLPVLLLSVSLSSTPAVGQQATNPLPISLDADSSSFDRRSNTVKFRGLRISQGALGIQADNALATGLDFENSEWQFEGNVRITIESAKILATTADLQFVNHQLLFAALRGQPARFTDIAQETGTPITGQANKFEYNTATGTIRMTEEAFLSEGVNEISGCDLTYDLSQETITATSSDCGQPVRMTIQPPQTTDSADLLRPDSTGQEP